MLRPRTTLYWIHRDGVVLARHDGRLERRPRADGAALAETLAAALPERRAGEAFVLAEELVAEAIELSARQTRGLTDAELESALAIELQTIAGLAPDDTALAWRTMPSEEGTRAFRVAAMSLEELAELDELLRSRGGRLVGLAHPAGLSRAVRGSARTDWSRRERWRSIDVEVAGDPRGGVRLVSRRDGAERRRVDEADEFLVAPDAGPATRDERTIDLADDAHAAAWLAAWRAELASGLGAVPVLAPATRPMSAGARVTIAVVLALLAAAACWFHDRGQRGTRDALRQEVVIAAQPAERVQTLRNEITRIEADLAQLEAEAPPVPPPPPPCAWSEHSPARWLRAIAEHRPQGLHVREFDLGAGRTSLRGVAVEPQLADEFAAALTGAFADDGCAVETRTKRLVPSEGGGALYAFELHVRGVQEAAR